MSGVSPVGAVVVITGASAGIGRASALAFANAGAKVAICARRADRLTELSSQIEARGGQCFARQADVKDQASLTSFVDQAAERFSGLDVMVNNAGYGVRGTFEQTTPEQWEELFRVNLMGTVYGCLAALPHLRRRGRGVIVNVSSIVGHRALAGGSAYAATKAAQISLTESLRTELAGTGIQALTVHPIGTATEFVEVAARVSGEGRKGGAVGPQQTAEQVAEAILAAVRSPRPEVYPHPLARLLVIANAISPWLVDWMMLRAARRAGRI